MQLVEEPASLSGAWDPLLVLRVTLPISDHSYNVSISRLHSLGAIFISLICKSLLLSPPTLEAHLMGSHFLGNCNQIGADSITWPPCARMQGKACVHTCQRG